MVGLVFAEEFVLSGPQWLALALNAAAWLWHDRQTYRRTSLSGPAYRWTALSTKCVAEHGCSAGQFTLTALLSFSALWIAFWNTPTSIDQQMLFEQAGYLARYTWPDFLEAIVSRPYVEYQPPFFTFWVSRFPVLWAQQLLFFPFALLCAALMFRLYGRPAALLCATPVFALMIHQPCNDTLLFGCLLIVLRLLQLVKATHPPAPSLAERGGEIPLNSPLEKGEEPPSLRSRSYAPRGNAQPDALRPFDAERRDLRERRSDALSLSKRASSRGCLPPFLKGGRGGFVYRLMQRKTLCKVSSSTTLKEVNCVLFTLHNLGSLPIQNVRKATPDFIPIRKIFVNEIQIRVFYNLT